MIMTKPPKRYTRELTCFAGSAEAAEDIRNHIARTYTSLGLFGYKASSRPDSSIQIRLVFAPSMGEDRLHKLDGTVSSIYDDLQRKGHRPKFAYSFKDTVLEAFYVASNKVSAFFRELWWLMDD